MKIFFVKPGDREWFGYPLQYAALSAYIKKQGHQVGFYDASPEGKTPEGALEAVDLGNYDVLAISIYTGAQNWAKKFISLARQKYPEIRVIVGGPHISALETDAVAHLDADIGIVGEGELPFAGLLQRLSVNGKYSDIPGLIWKEGGEWKNTLSMPLLRIKDTDSFPMADYELIPPTDYFDVFRGASVARRRGRCANIFTSRGCPYACTYCATNCTWSRKITALSAERVVEEILFLKEKYKIEEIWINDDTFTFSKQRVIDICRLLIEKKAGVLLRLPNGIRLESIDDEIASWMHRAGLYMTGVGVETGSESAMKMIKKKLDLKIVAEKLKILRKNKILVSGFFIYGFPWETKEQILETGEFILKNRFDRIQISIFNPYPGSEEFDNIMNKSDPAVYSDKIRKYLYEEKIDFFLQNLDLDYLYSKSRDTYIKFYTKPGVLWSILKGLTWQQIKDIIRHPIFRGFFKKKHESKDIYVRLNQ